MRFVWIASLAIASIAAPALACSCMSPEMISPERLAAMIAEYPHVVRARVTSSEAPFACRVAPVRWAYAVAGSRVPVRHNVAVRESVRGRPLGTIVVVQQQLVDYSGCAPQGSPACDPEYSTDEDIWALKASGDVFERAPMCTELIIRSALQL